LARQLLVHYFYARANIAMCQDCLGLDLNQGSVERFCKVPFDQKFRIRHAVRVCSRFALEYKYVAIWRGFSEMVEGSAVPKP
jgi:hypothetical protein